MTTESAEVNVHNLNSTLDIFLAIMMLQRVCFGDLEVLSFPSKILCNELKLSGRKKKKINTDYAEDHYQKNGYNKKLVKMMLTFVNHNLFVDNKNCFAIIHYETHSSL